MSKIDPSRELRGQTARSKGGASALARSKDWSRTPLGQREAWPASLRALVDVVLDHPLPMILLWGPDLIQIYNDGYARIAGAKHPAALGQPTRECWPEVWHINAPIYERVLTRGESVLLEDQLFPVSRNGATEDAFFTLAYSPVRDDEGRTGGVFLTVMETTVRVRAEREQERRQSAALAVADLGTFEWDVRTNAVALDDRSRAIFGFAPGEGTRAEEVFARIDPADFPRVFAEAQASHRDLSRLETAYRIVLPDGTARAVASINDAVAGPDGKAERMFGVFSDITARVRAEEALRASEERRRLALDSAELGSWHVDPATMTLTTDERFRTIFGVGDDQLDYERAVGLIHPDDRERVRHAVAAATRPDDPEPYAVEYRVVQPDGSARWVFAKGRANFAGSGPGRRIVSFDGTLADVTARKEAEAERQALLERERSARAEAEAANRAKDHFLAVLSHELRTPLTPVALTATAMEMDPALPFEFRDDVAMIRRNVELETRLIDDLLDHSRITSGKLRLNVQPTHVHEVVRHVLQTVGAELHEKQLRVEQHLGARRDRVDADPARLQQTLWNLLKNAAKFTPSGGRVFVNTRNEGGSVLIDVGDDGRGIAPEALPHVFEPFEQGDAGVTRQFGGMGLGLAIAKAVVEMHGGTISVASEGVGRGAVFTVALPLGKAVASADPIRADDAMGGGDRPVRLLLVEDHADSAKVLVRLLRQEGTEVQWAGTVAAALELAASETFDVVVSDLGLPDGTGYHLMRELLRRRPVAGIAMSGYGMDDDVRQSREAGFVEHLVKPVDLSQLRDAIRRAVRN